MEENIHHIVHIYSNAAYACGFSLGKQAIQSLSAIVSQRPITELHRFPITNH